MYKSISVKYSQKSNLNMQKCINERVHQYFKVNGLSQKANVMMWFRICFFVFLYIFSWWCLVSEAYSISWTSVYLVTMILAYKGIAYNIVHDSCHRSITKNKKLDDFIYWLSLSSLGPDPYLWKTRHNIDHHNYVNIPGLDSQLEGAVVFRLSPHQKWMPIHTYQHLYAPLIYSIVTLHWIFIRDFQDLFSASFIKTHTKGKFYFHFFRVLTLKLLYVLMMIVVPFLTLPYSLSTVVLTFIAFHLCLSLLVTLTFAVSHINKDLYFVNNDNDGNISHSFMEHQLKTSVDYSTGNALVNFVFGGMNCHVAHHIYPSISSVHLPALTQIIKQTTKEYGVKYHEQSLFSLVGMHFEYLKDLGFSKERGRHLLISTLKKNA